MIKGFTRKFKPLEILTEEQLDEIHRATLDVLWETGVRVEHGRALKLFKENGCKVDYEEKRVWIPPGLVEECLHRCPSGFRVKARDPNNDLVIGGNTVYFESAQGMQAVDLDTWEPRTPTRKDYYDGVTVLDALPNHHKIPHYTPYFGFEGVPPCMAMPEGLAARLRNSTRLTGTGYSNDCEVFNIEMAKKVGAELITFCLPAPPLTYFSDAIEAAYRYIEADFPVFSVTSGVMGGTYPSTIAGSVVLGSAELMLLVVLAQLLKPGAKILPGTFSFPQNMRTGSPAFGAIGASLHSVVFNQMWRQYGLPIWSGGAGYCSGKRIDYQTGYEKGIAGILCALSGGNVIQLHGGVSSELTYHPVMAILDDDIASMVGRFVEGVTVSDETIALELIEQVGPIPGHYLNTAHTREWWKKEQFVPKAADSLTYPEWMKAGKKSCLDYAKGRMEKILATHKVSIPLTPSQEEDIGRILNEARQFYRKKGMISDEEWEVYKEKVLESPDYPFS